MELLECLRTNYRWSDISFTSEDRIKTESGQKRIQFWSDKTLLEWHITWRDHCSDTPYVLIDRMIRNEHQEAAIEWKDGWITVHDDIVEPYPIKGQEDKIANVLAAMIDYGTNADIDNQIAILKEPEYQELYAFMPMFGPEQRQWLYSLLTEADIRMKKATSLEQSLDDTTIPLLDPITSIDQVRKVHDVLFWSGTADQPIRGYYYVSSFLNNWIQTFGDESVESFVDHLFEDKRMSKDQMLLLLAECLKPYELDPLTALLRQNPSYEQVELELTQLEEKWERQKKLVKLLSTMIDKKKVLAS